MIGTQRSSAPGAAPAAPFAETPWLTFGAVAGAVAPIARQAARTNLELSSLAAARAKAYMAIPETLSRCRTPFDVLQAQFAFWQDAGRQYAETTERLTSAWRNAATPDGQYERVEPRDFIGFPEPKPDMATEASRRPGEGRRAA